MIILSPRLAAAAAYVLPGRPLADIGTDHAYLPAHLVQAGAIPRAIAGDVLPGPLDAARSTVQEAGLTQQIELRLGNGLKILKPGEVATVTICGMGGPLIAEILEAGPLAGVERLVLQPMGGEETLRRWLMEHGWYIIDEKLVEDGGRIYAVMAAEPGHMDLTWADAFLGPHLLKKGGPLLKRYAAIFLEQARRAYEGAGRSDRPEALARRRELQIRINLLEEVIRNAEQHHR
ncbi:MAG TPA: class I SAM-dependent methyltransferase [Symbiobacteriaceae bacterium]|nr:class I SAM-dependent methyltransferase [Symbiobacteriaceae bacterium]